MPIYEFKYELELTCKYYLSKKFMFKIMLDILSVLDKKQKKEIIHLQVLIIIMSIFESIGVVSISPILAIIGNQEIIRKNIYIKNIALILNLTTNNEIILIIATICLLVFLTSTIISTYTIHKLFIFGTKLGLSLSAKLYSYYLEQEWEYHIQNDSVNYTNLITHETQRVKDGIINQILILNAKIILVLIIGTIFISVDIIIATIIIISYAGMYAFMYKALKMKINKYGEITSKSQLNRLKILKDSFGGIRDLIMSNTRSTYENEFKNESLNYALAQGSVSSIGQIPRYVLELIAFITMLILVLYLNWVNNGNMALIMPAISIYLIASVKLLPAFQQIYSSIVNIRASKNAFYSINQQLKKYTAAINENKMNEIRFEKNIILKNIKYSYHGNNEILKNIDLEIKKNEVVGIVGVSGSGKSTLVDIISGMLTHYSGEIYIDEIKLEKNDLKIWRKKIGIIPQEIYLTNGTILDNIKFGSNELAIGDNGIYELLKSLHMLEYVNGLEKGINTNVGERGVQLSGGQRQRIGIARVLYRKSEILILDEATSALDKTSENNVMGAIEEYINKKTIIIITHRILTLKKCDKVIFLQDGIIKDIGSYENVKLRNDDFANLE